MEGWRDFLVHSHVIAGFIGLLSFWIPVFSKKGGKTHRLFGKLFVLCCYIVGGSALIVSCAKLCVAELWAREVLHVAEDRLGAVVPRVRSSGLFLAYLAIVTIAAARHAVRVTQTRKKPEALGTVFHKGLMASCVLASSVSLIYGLFFAEFMAALHLAMSPIGLLVGLGALKFIKDPRRTRMAWWYEHMGNILGAGMGFHTAFLIVGLQGYVNLGLEGFVAVIPWLAPTIIGVLGTTLWIRYYRKKFGDL